MGMIYRNSHYHPLSSYDRTRYRIRMWIDLGKIVAGITLVAVGVQFIAVPTYGLVIAGVVAGTGAYLFISSFCRRAEDYFEKKDRSYFV